MIIMLLHNHIHMMIFQNLHRKIDIPSECRSEHNNRFKSQFPSPFMNTHISHQLRSFLTVSLTCESKYESLLLQFSWHHVFDVKGQASRKCIRRNSNHLFVVMPIVWIQWKFVYCLHQRESTDKCKQNENQPINAKYKYR